VSHPTYSLDLVTDLVQRGAADIAHRLEPDEDWQPVLVGLAEGGPVILAFPIIEGAKDQLVEVLAVIAQAHEFKAMAILTPVWSVGVHMEDSTEEERQDVIEHGLEVPPSQHPDRVEAVMLQTLDAEVMRFYHALITRRPGQHPLLGEWTTFGDQDHVDGRWARLRDALR
jgi:hypothetical protein